MLASTRFGRLLEVATLGSIVAILCFLLTPAYSCPFCEAVQQTFSGEIETADVAIIGKQVKKAAVTPKLNDAGFLDTSAEIEKVAFEVVQVIKGGEILGKARTIECMYYGNQPVDTKFLILGIGAKKPEWNSPIPLSERGAAYVLQLQKAPPGGADRLAFFQDYLEDKDEALARDAYDEFAKAPYADVKALGSRMKIEKLREWIQDTSVLASRRRLYLTMLGTCGKPEDAVMLEKLISVKNDEPKSALDAMIACYLTLKGADGMPLVENLFLKDEKAEYTDTYSAIMALRFHIQEETIIPKPRLVQGFRYMLDRPALADLVIPDLARWEDWSSMDRLVELFKKADDKNSWVRVPVVQYLRVCPLPKAAEHIAALEKIDPESVKRASLFLPLGGGAKKPAVAEAPALVPAPGEGLKAKEKTAPAENVAPVPAPAAKPAATPGKSAKRSKVQSEELIVPTTAPAIVATPNSNDGSGEGENRSGVVFVPLGVGLSLMCVLTVMLRATGGGVPA